MVVGFSDKKSGDLPANFRAFVHHTDDDLCIWEKSSSERFQVRLSIVRNLLMLLDPVADHSIVSTLQKLGGVGAGAAGGHGHQSHRAAAGEKGSSKFANLKNEGESMAKKKGGSSARKGSMLIKEEQQLKVLHSFCFDEVEISGAEKQKIFLVSSLSGFRSSLIFLALEHQKVWMSELEFAKQRTAGKICEGSYAWVRWGWPPATDNWSRRWLVLDGNALCYWAKREDAMRMPLGKLRLHESMQVKSDRASEKPGAFFIRTSSSKYLPLCIAAEEMENTLVWRNTICNIVGRGDEGTQPTSEEEQEEEKLEIEMHPMNTIYHAFLEAARSGQLEKAFASIPEDLKHSPPKKRTKENEFISKIKSMGTAFNGNTTAATSRRSSDNGPALIAANSGRSSAAPTESMQNNVEDDEAALVIMKARERLFGSPRPRTSSSYSSPVSTLQESNNETPSLSFSKAQSPAFLAVSNHMNAEQQQLLLQQLHIQTATVANQKNQLDKLQQLLQQRVDKAFPLNEFGEASSVASETHSIEEKRTKTDGISTRKSSLNSDIILSSPPILLTFISGNARHSVLSSTLMRVPSLLAQIASQAILIQSQSRIHRFPEASDDFVDAEIPDDDNNNERKVPILRNAAGHYLLPETDSRYFEMIIEYLRTETVPVLTSILDIKCLLKEAVNFRMEHLASALRNMLDEEPGRFNRYNSVPIRKTFVETESLLRAKSLQTPAQRQAIGRTLSGVPGRSSLTQKPPLLANLSQNSQQTSPAASSQNSPFSHQIESNLAFSHQLASSPFPMPVNAHSPVFTPVNAHSPIATPVNAHHSSRNSTPTSVNTPTSSVPLLFKPRNSPILHHHNTSNNNNNNDHETSSSLMRFLHRDKNKVEAATSIAPFSPLANNNNNSPTEKTSISEKTTRKTFSPTNFPLIPNSSPIPHELRPFADSNSLNGEFSDGSNSPISSENHTNSFKTTTTTPAGLDSRKSSLRENEPQILPFFVIPNTAGGYTLLNTPTTENEPNVQKPKFRKPEEFVGDVCFS